MSIILIPDENYFENFTDLYELNPNTLSCEPKPLDPTAALALCLVLIANFLLAVPGNVLVGWVIVSSRHVLTSSDVYLFHLTLADGLLALTLPFFAVGLVREWLFGDFMCKFLSVAMEATFYTSIVFLACISVDRYLVIVRANKVDRSHRRRRSGFLCAAVWALGWTLALPALFNHVQTFGEAGRFICTESFDLGRAASWRLATQGFRHIFGFLVPLAVMLVCYGVTVARLAETRGFQKHKAMRVIVAVVAAFLLCWMPYQAAMMVDTLMGARLVRFDCGRRTSVGLALNVTNALALLHSCINPLLYAFVGQKFRKRLMLLLRRKRRQERTTGSTFSRSTSQTSEGAGTFL